MIIDFDGKLYKIQVKTTQFIKDGAMIFSTGRTNPFKMTNICYTESEVDYFFLYCIQNQWCGLIKIKDFTTKALSIRINPPQNNNFNNCRMADDYEFSHRIDELKYGLSIPLIKYDNQEKNKKIQSKSKEIVNEIKGRTDRNRLKDEIRKYPITKVAELYGVTDNAIRKWCRKMGLPDKSTHIKRYSDEEWEKI